MDTYTEKLNDIYQRITKFDYDILNKTGEYKGIDFDGFQKNIDLFNERQGEKSKFGKDERDSAKLAVYRFTIIRALITKYLSGLEGNQNLPILDAYNTLQRGKVKFFVFCYSLKKGRGCNTRTKKMLTARED